MSTATALPAGTWNVDPFGNDRVGLEVTGEISRKDFGMKFDAAVAGGNLVVGDKVKLELDISAIKQA
ncbi:MAG: YceI family protein [Solirubrobacteraceae bacterium]